MLIFSTDGTPRILVLETFQMCLQTVGQSADFSNVRFTKKTLSDDTPHMLPRRVYWRLLKKRRRIIFRTDTVEYALRQPMMQEEAISKLKSNVEELTVFVAGGR